MAWRQRPWKDEQKDLEGKGYLFDEDGNCTHDPTNPNVTQPKMNTPVNKGVEVNKETIPSPAPKPKEEIKKKGRPKGQGKQKKEKSKKGRK